MNLNKLRAETVFLKCAYDALLVLGSECFNGHAKLNGGAK